jgi:N-acetylmuramoyl-L-alanine amidase
MLLTASTMCLALNMFYEARNQPIEGQLMVAQVTLNRVASDRYPNTVCEVVWQKKQFSWTHDGLSDEPSKLTSEVDQRAWEEVQETAHYIFHNQDILIGSIATHYHAVDVEPWWASSLTYEGQVGDHYFYSD